MILRVWKDSVFLSYLWFPKILFTSKVHDKHICWLQELFLYAAGRYVDSIFMSDAGSAARACYLECHKLLVSQHLFLLCN